MAEAGCIGGLYEVGVGVPDLAASIRYFEAHGYRVGDIGELYAPDALALYGHDSALRSVRLLHQNADHGLVRLMRWEKPLNDGIGLGDLEAHGTRWTGQMTLSIANYANHCAVAAENGQELRMTDPIFVGFHAPGSGPRAFVDPVVAVREMAVLQPLYRQFILERFNYRNEAYGRINRNCLMATSQMTHCGAMVVSDDHTVVDFYEEAMGLFRSTDKHVAYEDAVLAARTVFRLREGEPHWIIDFDNPENAGKAWNEQASGRLKIVRRPPGYGLDDIRDRARPGCLGYSLYTWRLRDVEAVYRKVEAAGAQNMSDIVSDEFGQRAFGFTAPDGYPWVLMEA